MANLANYAERKTVADDPRLFADWDPTNPKGAVDTALSGGDRVRWKCAACQHQWEASPRCRSAVAPGGVQRRASRGRDCLRCASLGMKHPTLLEEWHPDNATEHDPFLLAPGSHVRVKWKCSATECGYEWLTTIAHRAVRGHGCEQCLGRIASADHNAAVRFPHLLKEWHPTRNEGARLEDFTPRSNQYAWWRCVPAPAEQQNVGDKPQACTEAHEWRASIANRAKTGCPFLKGSRIPYERSLRALHPKIADELDVLRNGEEQRADVLGCSSMRKVYWTCADHGEGYRDTVDNRVNKGTGCRVCSGRETTPTSNFGSKHPNLLLEWDKERNLKDPPADWDKAEKFLPENLPPMGGRWAAWWKCRNCDVRWRAPIANRACHGHECPECGLYRMSRREILLAFEIGSFLTIGLASEDRTISAGGRRWAVDVAIRDHGIAVEYDGAFWHGSAEAIERDRRKTTALLAEGWRVLRVREIPLDDLTKEDGLPIDRARHLDVAVTKDDAAHVVAAIALTAIRDHFGVQIQGLDEYVEQARPRRAREARAHIDLLLQQRR